MTGDLTELFGEPISIYTRAQALPTAFWWTCPTRRSASAFASGSDPRRTLRRTDARYSRTSAHGHAAGTRTNSHNPGAAVPSMRPILSTSITNRKGTKHHTNTNADSIETIEIPFKKLVEWEGNVRGTATEEGIEELAASIANHGRLQSLVVRREPRGNFGVVAGRRRLLALSRLVDSGNMKPTAPDFMPGC